MMMTPSTQRRPRPCCPKLGQYVLLVLVIVVNTSASSSSSTSASSHSSATRPPPPPPPLRAATTTTTSTAASTTNRPPPPPSRPSQIGIAAQELHDKKELSESKRQEQQESPPRHLDDQSTLEAGADDASRVESPLTTKPTTDDTTNNLVDESTPKAAQTAEASVNKLSLLPPTGDENVGEQTGDESPPTSSRQATLLGATTQLAPPPPPRKLSASTTTSSNFFDRQKVAPSKPRSLDELRRLVRGDDDDVGTGAAATSTTTTNLPQTANTDSQPLVLLADKIEEANEEQTGHGKDSSEDRKRQKYFSRDETKSATKVAKEEDKNNLDHLDGEKIVVTSTVQQQQSSAQQGMNDMTFQRLKSTPPPAMYRVIPPPPPPRTTLAANPKVIVKAQQSPTKKQAHIQTTSGPPMTPARAPPRLQQQHNAIKAAQQPPRQLARQAAPYDVPSYGSVQQQYRHPGAAASASTSSHSSTRQRLPPPPGYPLSQNPNGPQAAPRQYDASAGRPQPTRTVASTASPGLQSLWSRVERRLDDLANLEDAITGRASNLVHTAVPKKWRRPATSTTPTTTSSQQKPHLQQRPRSGRSPTKRGPTSQPLLTPHKRWQQQQHTSQNQQTRPKSSSSQPTISRHPFPTSPSLLDITNRRYGSSPKSKSAVSVEKVDWDHLLSGNARKLMPANGGASSPNDHQSWNFPGDGQGTQVSAGQTRPDASRDASPGVDSIQREPQKVADASQQQGFTSRQYADHGNMQQQQTSGGLQNGRSSATPPQGQAWQQQSTNRGQQAASSGKGGRPAFSEQALKATSPGPTSQASRSQSYSDDDDNESLLSRMIGAIPIPSIGNIGKMFRFRRGKIYNNYASLDAWDAEEDDRQKARGFLGIFRRNGKPGSSPSAVGGKKGAANDGNLPQPVQRLLERSDKGKTASLLSANDKKRIRGIGKSRALFDAITLSLFIWGIRELNGLETVPFPTTLQEFGSVTLPGLLTCILSSVDTWAPFALVAALLTVWTNSLLFDGRVERVATDVSKSVEAEASYGRLFLRLVASTPTDTSLPDRVFRAAGLQVSALAELSRLRSYVMYAITAIVLTTVDFIRPLVLSILSSIVQLGSLPELRTWPIPFDKLLAESKAIFGAVGHQVSAIIGGELKGAGHHPMQVAFKASILAALLAVACLPGLEKRRKFTPNDDSEEENTEEVSRRMAEQISDMGASSASRLGVLSNHGGVESTIERWRLVQEESSNMVGDISIGSLFRRLGYYITSWCILVAPLLMFGFLLDVPISGWTSATVSRWEALFEVSLLLLFTNGLAWKATAKAVESSGLRPDVLGFLKSLSQASEEISPRKVTAQPLRSGANPTAGLVVKNFWAAHVVKRAWAVRGANLFCRNGEVLVLLGDDGAGKTRLLTSVAESIISPPKQALTAQVQRGNVSVGGIDVTQWDRNELKKRVGLFLNDIRTLANRAELWSGLSLEEILEPGDGLKMTDPTHTSGAREKACMIQALKITGLYWSLLPRLPSKLSTILTSNEEDLRPSPFRPRYFVISPSEWNKLMIAKLLAQAIYDSDNSVGATDKVDNSLVGSLFLLDDATMLLSEIEESKLIKDLRRTGAATVLSSNKWATGRLADRIAIVKDGTIVETGTHNELLSRGPQQSYYAAKWHAMTSA